MFSAKEENLHQVFSEKRYSIPFYQRPYSWQIDNAENLWNDLFLTWREEGPDGSGYFLGSVVLVSKPQSNRDDVVDGQQRFITLQLLLSAISMSVSNPDTRRRLRKYILSEEDEFAGTKSELVVEPGKRYQSIFEKVISGNYGDLKKERSAIRFLENFKFFKDAASELEQDDLVGFGKFILQEAHLAVLRADSDVKALKIFSVLNDRGIDLHPVDILKATILEKTTFSDRQKQKHAEEWEEYEERFERSRFQDLISHIRMTYVRARTQIPLHEDILRRIGSSHAAEEFLKNELSAFASAFEELQFSDEIVLQNLREIGKRARFKDWEAPALFLLKEKKPNFNYTQVIRELSAIVAFMAVTKMPDGQRAGRFGKIIDDFSDLLKGEKKIGHLDSLKLSKAEWANFEANLSSDAYSIRGLKAGLLWLESVSGDNERSISSGEVTIEHLLPRAVGQEKSWSDSFLHEEWAENSNRLGNLLLVSGRVNKKLARKSFADKKKYINDKGGTPWVWTQAALENEDWNLEKIKARERKMLDKAKSWMSII